MQFVAVGSNLKAKVKLLLVGAVGCVGRAMTNTLFAASLRLRASPSACPDRARELIHGEFIRVALPVRWEVRSCPSSIEIVGASIDGLAVELNVPV